MWFAVFEFGKANPRHRIPIVHNKKIWGEYNLQIQESLERLVQRWKWIPFLFSFYTVLPSYDSSSGLYYLLKFI